MFYFGCIDYRHRDSPFPDAQTPVGGILMLKKTIGLLFAATWMLAALPAAAEVYRYVDDDGNVRYTNDLTTIPPDKLYDVTKHKEFESDDASAGSRQSVEGRSSRQPQRRVYETRTQQIAAHKKKLRAQKKQLTQEYERLLKEKEAIDNDKGFQKRRNKAKYQNRPYIQALIKKEKELKQQLAETKRKLDAIESKL
jgi:hypothetical protein